jgi:hypothetical protein
MSHDDVVAALPGRRSVRRAESRPSSAPRCRAERAIALRGQLGDALGLGGLPVGLLSRMAPPAPSKAALLAMDGGEAGDGTGEGTADPHQLAAFLAKLERHCG